MYYDCVLKPNNQIQVYISFDHYIDRVNSCHMKTRTHISIKYPV